MSAGLKHRLKLALREGYARTLYHTGLHAAVNRLMPTRLTILFGHCVDAPTINGFLSPDMKIGAENLARKLRWFGKRYDLVTIGEGHRALASGAARRSCVALSMDDGYRDNHSDLLPILERTGARATVFLESRPLDERRVNWSHKYFWVLAQHGAEHFARQYLLAAEDRETCEKLRRLLEEDTDLVYQVKRILKYEAPVEDRDRTTDRVFLEAGGDEAALCDQLYMTWDDARALQAAGVELGGHTVHHAILSRCDQSEALSEVRGCADSMRRELPGWEPETFAYPFGRRWDYDEASVEATRQAGWQRGVNTHAGTNGPGAEEMELRRIPIDDSSRMHLLVTEACGGFDLLRRFGLDLSE